MRSMSASLWPRFQQHFLSYDELGFSLDISRMRFADDFFAKMQPKIEHAFSEMQKLESGAIANPDENRMVGHYWLRAAAIAPNDQVRAEMEETNASIKHFAADVHSGKISAAKGERFRHVLLIGIGGSALGPQFVADALGTTDDKMAIHFFDNTDPDGFDRVLDELGDDLGATLVVVISKSGGTKETRNGMLEVARRFEKKGLDFAKQAVAVTGDGSELDRYATEHGWLARFPMFDWIGGRTSVMSAVGLLPAVLQGVDIDNFLAGAAAMDEQTRKEEAAAQRRHAPRADVALRGERARREGHGRSALQGSAPALQPLFAAARHGVVRERTRSEGRSRAPGDRGLREQGLDRSARVCAAAARRGGEFFRRPSSRCGRIARATASKWSRA